MIVGILRIIVDVPESRSLKDKRAVLSSLKVRIGSRFDVAVAEVGGLNLHQRGELGVACVSNDVRQADGTLAKVADFAIASTGDGMIAHFETEILHLD